HVHHRLGERHTGLGLATNDGGEVLELEAVRLRVPYGDRLALDLTECGRTLDPQIHVVLCQPGGRKPDLPEFARDRRLLIAHPVVRARDDSHLAALVLDDAVEPIDRLVEVTGRRDAHDSDRARSREVVARVHAVAREIPWNAAGAVCTLAPVA